MVKLFYSHTITSKNIPGTHTHIYTHIHTYKQTHSSGQPQFSISLKYSEKPEYGMPSPGSGYRMVQML